MKIEQELGSSQLIVFVDPLADTFSDKEAEKSQSGIQIGYGTSKQFLTEISSERFSYVAEATFREAKNLVSYLKEQALHEYRYLK